MHKRRIAGAVAMLIVLIILPSATVFADADEPLPPCGCEEPADGSICCFYKLIEEIELGYASLVFGADVAVPPYEWLWLDGVQIETGEHRLIVEGLLFLGENTTVSGSGLTGAVIEIEDGGELIVGDAAYNAAPVVSATGVGGVALSLCSGAWYSTNESSFLKINSNGGIGIYSEIPLDLILHFIEAGSGKGIVCSEEVSLFLCRVSGGLAAVEAPDVFTDTSVLIPSNGINVIQRYIYRLSPNRAVLDIGEAQPSGLFPADAYTAVTYRAEGADDRVIYQPIRADIPVIDTSEPGDFPVYPIIEDWMTLCGMFPCEEAPFTIAVRDLRIPAYQHLDYMPGWFGLPGSAYIHFRYNGDDTEALTLWRSDDEGENWQDATDAHDFDLWVWDSVLVLTLFEQLEHPIWLVWEVADVGESEILIVVFDGENAVGNPGGDRSGIDRGETYPPPDPHDDGLDDDGDDPPAPPPGNTDNGDDEKQPAGGNAADDSPNLPPAGSAGDQSDARPPDTSADSQDRQIGEDDSDGDGIMGISESDDDALPGNSDDTDVVDVMPDIGFTDSNRGEVGIMETQGQPMKEERDELLFAIQDIPLPLSSLTEARGNDFPPGQPDVMQETPTANLPIPVLTHPEQNTTPGALYAAALPAASTAQILDAGLADKGGFPPAVIMGGLGLVAAAAYLIISAKKRGRARQHGYA